MQAEHNVENSLLLPRKVLHTNEFRLSGHFYIILPATVCKVSQCVVPYRNCGCTARSLEKVSKPTTRSTLKSSGWT
jgi:hypothetical protein